MGRAMARGESPPRRARTRRLLAVPTLAVVFAGLATLPATADTSGGANHVVLASVTVDGASALRSGVQVASAGSPTVASANIARAQSQSCTGCRAAAAAFQAVFVTHNADTVAPQNAAVAVNSNCTSCDSFAFAYQYVLTTPGPVYLSGTAQQQIAGIRQQVADATASGLPDDQLDIRLHDLAGQFKAVIDDGLRQAGVPADGAANERAEIAPA
jgi:hypothetical protein